MFSLNYLYTPTARSYVELGGGIEHIFGLGRVDFFTSLQQGQGAGAGLRVGLGF